MFQKKGKLGSTCTGRCQTLPFPPQLMVSQTGGKNSLPLSLAALKRSCSGSIRPWGPQVVTAVGGSRVSAGGAPAATLVARRSGPQGVITLNRTGLWGWPATKASTACRSPALTGSGSAQGMAISRGWAPAAAPGRRRAAGRRGGGGRRAEGSGAGGQQRRRAAAGEGGAQAATGARLKGGPGIGHRAWLLSVPWRSPRPGGRVAAGGAGAPRRGALGLERPAPAGWPGDRSAGGPAAPSSPRRCSKRVPYWGAVAHGRPLQTARCRRKPSQVALRRPQPTQVSLRKSSGPAAAKTPAVK